jgi:hypothetical protein
MLGKEKCSENRKLGMGIQLEIEQSANPQSQNPIPEYRITIIGCGLDTFVLDH